MEARLDTVAVFVAQKDRNFITSMWQVYLFKFIKLCVCVGTVWQLPTLLATSSRGIIILIGQSVYPRGLFKQNKHHIRDRKMGWTMQTQSTGLVSTSQVIAPCV